MIEVLKLVLLSLGNKTLKYIFIENFLIKRSLSTFKGHGLVSKYKPGFIQCVSVDFSLPWISLGGDKIQTVPCCVMLFLGSYEQKHPLTIVEKFSFQVAQFRSVSIFKEALLVLLPGTSISLKVSLSNPTAYICPEGERPSESAWLHGFPGTIKLFASLA